MPGALVWSLCTCKIAQHIQDAAIVYIRRRLCSDDLKKIMYTKAIRDHYAYNLRSLQ